MDLRVLGPIEVLGEAGSIDLGTRMHRAVLGMLAMDAGRVVSTDRLIDNLWGEEPPATAAKALQVYISGLRKALEPNRAPKAPPQTLVTQPPGYVLRVPAETIDAARFEALAAEGQELLARGRSADACDALERGLALWRGRPYEDLAFESFIQSEVARLNELRDAAAEVKAESLLAMGRHIEAVVDVERMVAESPLRERRWALLALALYRAGRQGDALRALERARRRLGDELGLDPGPELRRLERDILAQSPTLDLRLPEERPARTPRRVPMVRALGTVRSLAFVPPAPAGWTTGGQVLPPSASPHGVTLAEIATAVVPFTMSGHDPQLYPETPLQVLYIDIVDVRPVGTGTLVTGTNAFTVTAGKNFYVPIFTVTDGPPVVGVFPTTPLQAPSYFFDPTQYGGRDFELVVDGMTTLVGPEYLVGPLPYRGYEGTQFITLGAFVAPLGLAKHSIRVRGGVFGRSFAEAEGVSFIQVDFAYTVDVLEAVS